MVKYKEALVFKEFIPMQIPTATFQAKGMGVNRRGKPFLYSKPGAKKIKDVFTFGFKKYLSRYLPITPYDCAIKLDVEIIYEANKTHKIGEYKITKPDRDNLLKTMQDVLEKIGMVKNDSRICDGNLKKVYGAKEGVFISMTTMEKEKWIHKNQVKSIYLMPI